MNSDDYAAPVLNDGFVRLDAALADDLSVVNAARVSLKKRSELERLEFYEADDYHLPEEHRPEPHVRYVLSEADAGLIRFLMRERHGSPFEHNLFRFHVKCPIFVAREWMRHRIGSFNEWSGRYAQLEPSFYLPDAAYTQVGKPGAYSFEEMSANDTLIMHRDMAYAYNEAYSIYEELLERGVAKELARSVLPVGIYTEFYWSINARSLMNFLSLRCAPNAQAAIRAYAEVVLDFFKYQMPVTAQSFIDSGMVTP